jgi:hypothetical protein
MTKQEADRITNRHIAQLLDSVEAVYNLPDMVKAQIKMYMHYLKDNLVGKPEEVSHENPLDQA